MANITLKGMPALDAGGPARTGPDCPWAWFIYGEKGALKASTMHADFIPPECQA